MLKLIKLAKASLLAIIIIGMQSCSGDKKVESIDDMRAYLNGKQFKATFYKYKGLDIKTEVNVYFTDKYVYTGSPAKTAKYLISKKDGNDGTRFTSEPFYFYITFEDDKWKGLVEMKVASPFTEIHMNFPDGGCWVKYEKDFESFPGNPSEAENTGSTPNDDINTSSTNPVTNTETGVTETKPEINPEELVKGTWVGTMSDKSLTIVIDNIDGNSVTGFNQLADNKRDLKGEFTTNEDKSFQIEMDEPGTDKWDGHFSLKLSSDGKSISGSWKSNNGKMNKTFTLTRSE